MAAPEAIPHGSGEFGEGVRVVGQPVSVFIEGEHHIVIHPGNYGDFVTAYLLNREGEPALGFLQYYQEHLANYPEGQAITEAFDRQVSEDESQLPTLYALGALEGDDWIYYHAKTLDTTAKHLPPGLGPEFLRDPHLIP